MMAFYTQNPVAGTGQMRHDFGHDTNPGPQRDGEGPRFQISSKLSNSGVSATK